VIATKELKMPRVAVFLSLVTLAVVLVLAPPAATENQQSVPGDSSVSPWIALQLQQIASHRVNPPRAARGLALASVAIYRAERAAARGSTRAAIAGAASTVLSYLFPDATGRFRELAARTAGRGRAGLRLGNRIGARVVVRALDDRSDSVWTGQVPSGSELWVPTPPAFQALPLEPLAGAWRPWNVSSGIALRPSPPPRPGTALFDRELLEVYEIARSLTDEQRRIAEFWADGAGTFTPPGHWNAIALDLVRGHRVPTRAAARLFATMNTAQADAFICAWDAKYAYWSVRPVTAIRRQLDPGWSPHIATPPFPAYVSGHSTTSGAASRVLERFFPRRAGELRAMAEEAADSRLYGGIHFRSDNDVGLTLGRAVAAEALAASRTDRAWTEP
jgi:membrane-associated phospholipid phosphatase